MNTKSTFFCIATAAVFLNASYAQDYDKTIDGSAGPVDAHSAADLTGPSGLLSKLDLGSTDAATPAIINILDDITFAATEGTADQRLANNWYYSRHAEIRVADGKTLTFTGNSMLHPAPDHGSSISGSALSWYGDYFAPNVNATLYIGAMGGGENSGRIVFSNNINSASNGGAIYVGNSSLVISNADFISNSCTREDAYGAGGAIFSDSKLEISNSSFENNTSAFREGGAIFANRSTVIKDSQFKNNKANMGGSAISSNYGLFIENSTFCDNSGSISGGAIINFGGIKVVGSFFENNTGGAQGGAILFLGASPNYAEATRQLEINESSFRNNTGDFGGAIFSQGTTIIENSTFDSNSAYTKGGALHINTPLTEDEYNAYVFINNSSFTNNKATGNADGNSYGGAFSYDYIDDRMNPSFNGSPKEINGTIKDTSFIGNSAKTGGALYVSGPGKFVFEVSEGKHLESYGNEAEKGGFLYANCQQRMKIEEDTMYFVYTAAPEVVFAISSGATYVVGKEDDKAKDTIYGEALLHKTGKGELILNGNSNGFYGKTVVDEGKLTINGMLGGTGKKYTIDNQIEEITSSMTVNDGGVLGGSGRISGETTINVGGVIAPGNSPGTITFDKLILNDGAILDIEKGDLIVADELDLSNIVNGVELNFTGFSQGDTVRFLEIRDIIGIDLETENLNDYFIANGFDFYFDADTNSIIANYVVPEPATAAAILGVFALAFAAYKRRK